MALQHGTQKLSKKVQHLFLLSPPPVTANDVSVPIYLAELLRRQLPIDQKISSVEVRAADNLNNSIQKEK